MDFEKCPNSTGEDCFRPVGAECRLPERGVCDHFVVQRAKFFYSLASVYAQRRNKNKKLPPIAVNENAIYVAVKSIYDDIYRYKWYHLTDPRSNLADSVKLSAYSCKWISRIQPLEYREPLDRKNSDDISGLVVNVAFALHMSRTFIGAELGKEFYFKDHYEDEFVYDLFYREMNADGLLHIFQNIFSAVKIRRAGILHFPRRKR